MDNKEIIIDKIAREGTLRQILQNIGCVGADAEDLEQDIFLSLFDKDEELLSRLYQNNEIRYYLTKIAKNNFNSKTSPFYKTYKKKQENYGLLEQLIDKEKLDD